MSKIKEVSDKIKNEVCQVFKGNSDVVDMVLACLFAGGHVLLEDVPGTGKTVLAKSVAKASGLAFSRIQCTPDLMPSDVTGSSVWLPDAKQFEFRAGPVMASIVLVDELNRATPRTQSALLECMAEGQVSVDGARHELEKPFFVLATQNPVEQEGTYNLPEAELDRFLMKLVISYPATDNEIKIVQTCGNAPYIPVRQIIKDDDIKMLREAASKITCDEKLVEYIVSILTVTRPENSKKQQGGRTLVNTANTNDITRYIHFGASPRAGIAMLQCAKVKALFAGRDFVLSEDIKAVALNVLRHRLVLSYEAAADNITADDIITRILDFIPVP